MIPYIEVGVGEVEKYLRSRLDLKSVTSIGILDDVLNLSRISFGPPIMSRRISTRRSSPSRLRSDRMSRTALSAARQFRWLGKMRD